MKHPLNGAIQQNRVFKLRDLPVKPEMDSGDRRGFEMRQALLQRLCGGGPREHPAENIKWYGKDHEIKGLLLPAYQQLHLRSEEHTSELQSRGHLVCRLLLEKKKK